MNKLFLTLLLSTWFSGYAQAEVLPFDQDAFAQKLKAGEAVVIAAHAPWCSTCRAQKPILKQLSVSKPYQQLPIYEVDFDSQKATLGKLNISRQSTLVAFKQGKEVTRSVGATSPGAIEAILKSVE